MLSAVYAVVVATILAAKEAGVVLYFSQGRRQVDALNQVDDKVARTRRGSSIWHPLV
jgi:hypothetical protein